MRFPIDRITRLILQGKTNLKEFIGVDFISISGNSLEIDALGDIALPESLCQAEKQE